MKQNGLIKKAKRHPNGITREDASAQKSENLIQRDFTAEDPNKKWLSDITEVPCSDGKLYVAAVMDCCGGEIVGLTMDDNMRKELCIQAFESACKAQNAYGMVFHSDRGSQFTSYAFRASLARYGAVQSMSGTGRCYDNARMESFFATLKKEKLYQLHTERYPMAWIKSVIFRYVMVYYNRAANRTLRIRADGRLQYTARDKNGKPHSLVNSRQNFLEPAWSVAEQRGQKIHRGVSRLHFS